MGHMMNESNIGMTLNAIKQLALEDNDVVLELGHGVFFSVCTFSFFMLAMVNNYFVKSTVAFPAVFVKFTSLDLPFTVTRYFP